MFALEAILDRHHGQYKKEDLIVVDPSDLVRSEFSTGSNGYRERKFAWTTSKCTIFALMLDIIMQGGGSILASGETIVPRDSNYLVCDVPRRETSVRQYWVGGMARCKWQREGRAVRLLFKCHQHLAGVPESYTILRDGVEATRTLGGGHDESCRSAGA